jgi:hypothetical protein
MTKDEHNEMTDRLIEAGTCLAEAEQIIISRKNAFSKACRYLKMLTNLEPNWQQKKANKQRKLVSSQMNVMEY